MTIPNLITVFRLVPVPVVILMILQEDWGWAFALFVIAGISDGLEGFIARRFDTRSAFGAVIDPLAARTWAPPVGHCPAAPGLCGDACKFGPERA